MSGRKILRRSRSDRVSADSGASFLVCKKNSMPAYVRPFSTLLRQHNFANGEVGEAHVFFIRAQVIEIKD